MSTRCGFVAIVGRPNVGKSTLLNALLGKKLSITSRKPQTTRHRILGIKTQEETQFIFVDTPGLHQTEKGVLNRHLNRAALGALREVDVIIWVIDANDWRDDDQYVVEKLQQVSVPIILAMNKTDLLPSYDEAIPLVEKFSQQLPHLDIIPISATKDFQIMRLLALVRDKLPESPFYFDADKLTDRSEAFVAAELIREQVIRSLGQELPYATTVTIESLQKKQQVLHIQSIIFVAREGQKPIVIGKQGERLKKISTAARLSLERYFDCKVFLQVWVKVKNNWSENETLVRDLLQ